MHDALPWPDLGPGLDLLVVQEGRHVLAQLQLAGLGPRAGSGRSDQSSKHFPENLNIMTTSSPDREASGSVRLPFTFPTLVF